MALARRIEQLGGHRQALLRERRDRRMRHAQLAVLVVKDDRDQEQGQAEAHHHAHDRDHGFGRLHGILRGPGRPALSGVRGGRTMPPALGYLFDASHLPPGFACGFRMAESRGVTCTAHYPWASSSVTLSVMTGSCGPGSSRIRANGESHVNRPARTTAPAPAISMAARRPRWSPTQPPARPPRGAAATVSEISVAVTRPSRRSGVSAWRSDR